MAVFGEIILFLFGLYVLIYGCLVSVWVADMSGNSGNIFWSVIPICIGGGLMYVAIHYGPITISIGG